MNPNQADGNANEAKRKVKDVSGKVTGDKRTEYKDKANKDGGKNGAVLGKLNDDARKKAK